MFKELIKRRHPLKTTNKDDTPPPLTYEETCGLRYLAGYIPKLLRRRLQTSKHPMRDDILLCIYDMLDDGDEEEDVSQDWVKAVNRGGLTLVNNVTFDAFLAIEDEVRKAIWSGTVELNDDVMKSIARSEDVVFYWSLVSGEWDEGSSDALLQMVVNQYIKNTSMVLANFGSAWLLMFCSKSIRWLLMSPKFAYPISSPECLSNTRSSRMCISSIRSRTHLFLSMIGFSSVALTSISSTSLEKPIEAFTW